MLAVFRVWRNFAVSGFGGRHSRRRSLSVTLAMNDNAQSAKSMHDFFWEFFAFVWVVVSAMHLAGWDNRAFWDGDRPPPLLFLQLSFILSGSLLLTLLWKSFYTMHAQQRAASAMGDLV